MNPARRLFLSSVASAAAFVAPLRAVAGPSAPVDLAETRALGFSELMDRIRGCRFTHAEADSLKANIDECTSHLPRPTLIMGMRQNLVCYMDTRKCDATDVMMTIEMRSTKRKGQEIYDSGLHVFNLGDPMQEIHGGLMLMKLSTGYDLNDVDRRSVHGMMKIMQDPPFGSASRPRPPLEGVQLPV